MPGQEFYFRLQSLYLKVHLCLGGAVEQMHGMLPELVLQQRMPGQRLEGSQESVQRESKSFSWH